MVNVFMGLINCSMAAKIARNEPAVTVITDANWMAANGIPTVTLGCGQIDIHTTREQLDLNAFEAACAVALRLATG